MRVIVNEDTDFEQSWTDRDVPNMNWTFNEQSLDECEEEDGVYYATYDELVLTQPRVVHFVKEEELCEVIVPAGTYGLRTQERNSKP